MSLHRVKVEKLFVPGFGIAREGQVVDIDPKLFGGPEEILELAEPVAASSKKKRAAKKAADQATEVEQVTEDESEGEESEGESEGENSEEEDEEGIDALFSGQD